MRRETPIAFVSQLGSTLLTTREDISISEKQIDVFSSHQPEGLMNRLMGHNMMRKDGEAHQVERRAFFPAVSPKAMTAHWKTHFQEHADHIIRAIEPGSRIDLMRDIALPFSDKCLKSITGLTNIGFAEMDTCRKRLSRGSSIARAILGLTRVAMRRHRALMLRLTTCCQSCANIQTKACSACSLPRVWR